jgi:uncharacterized membrane protein YhaH (DUF805 family)
MAMHWMILPYRRYFEFSGRSRRKEYWFFALFTTVVIVALMGAAVGVVAANLQGMMEWTPAAWQNLGVGFWILGGLLVLFALASIIPGVAVQVRRLHDLGVSGWWYLAFLVGGAVLDQVPNAGQGLGSLLSIGWIVWMFMPGTKGPNAYGEDPKDPVNVAVFA